MATAAASTHTAIILITDLVGSTELRARLGEDAAEELRRVHDRLLLAAIVDHKGEVVKGLGDGVLARFTGAADAVAAAVEIQQVASRDGFDVRVGVSAGDITVEDGDVFGTPVIEASRLCARAEGGQILVAQLVQLLARGRGGHAFTAIGELELKGLTDAVAAAEVGWEPLPSNGPTAAPDAPQPPLQPALAAEERFAYAGRLREREALELAWKRVAQGERRLVLLSGEPGMGKTRLAVEVARSVHGAGATVLLGRADEDLTSPYRPLAEALRHLVGHVPTSVLEDHVRSHGDALVRLVPDLLRRVPDAPPAAAVDDERIGLFDAVVDLLGRSAAGAPVLLILDDLHWADHSTLLFLRHVARSAPAMALLLVGTYRDTDLSRDHPLAGVLADLRREASVERVALAGLDDGEVAELMTVAAGHDLDEAALVLAGAIHEETGGNPFFIGEVLWHLAESGLIYERDGRWTTDPSQVVDHVPDGVREVIGRRLSALGKEADKALRTAAAVGAEFHVEVLAAVLGADEDDLIDLLDEPLSRRLIEEVPGSPGRFRFAHALVRQALYEELSALRRSRLHARILDVLRATGCREATVLAHHACEAAASGSAELAVELAAEAAEEATAHLALEEAVAWYERALESEEVIEDPDPRRRAALLIALGRAKHAIGYVKEANGEFAAAADLARDVDDIDLLCRAAVDYAMGAGAWIDPDDRVGPALIDEALSRLPDEDSVVRARLLISRSWWFVLSDHAEQRRLTEEALVVARRVDDPETLRLALGARANAVVASPDLTELAAVVDELRSLLTDDVSTRERFTLHLNDLIAHIRAGDLVGAARVAVDFANDGARFRSPLLRFRALTTAAGLDLLAGRVDDAREKLGRAEAVDVGASEGWLTVTGTLANSIAAVCEPPEELLVTWRRMVDAAPAFFRVFPDAELIVQARTGRADEARLPLRTWAENIFPRFPEVYRPAGFAVLSPAWPALDADLAERFHHQLLPYEGQWLTAFPENVWGVADLHLARFDRAAGRLDHAVARYDRALAEHVRAGERCHRVHIQVELAELLVDLGRDGNQQRARRLAEEAAAAARQMGMRWMVTRAEELL